MNDARPAAGDDKAFTARLRRAERLLGRRFGDRQLLLQALTHRSSGDAHNERMEFLGDALLDAVIAEALYQRFPDEREGRLTAWRGALVNGRALAEIMRERNMHECLVLGPSIQRIRHSPSILGNAFEAIVAAVYLDAGFAACRDFVLAWYAGRLEPAHLREIGHDDAKTRLQKRVQALGVGLPKYTMLAPCPDGASTRVAVHCEVSLRDARRLRASATAGTRQDAEQRAAEALLARWEDAPEASP